MILYLYVIICIAVVVWAVFQLIKIDKEYKRCLKRIDEWYQSETKRTEWIPVSERLPETLDDMLVTDGANMAVGYYRPDAKAWDSTSFAWLENRSEPPYGIKTVVAWMPLPEPYMEE